MKSRRHDPQIALGAGWALVHLGLVAVALAAVPTVAGAASALPANDYPTATRADYVLGCMAANGKPTCSPSS